MCEARAHEGVGSGRAVCRPVCALMDAILVRMNTQRRGCEVFEHAPTDGRHERSLSIILPPTHFSPGDHHDRLLRGRGLDRCRLRRQRIQLVQRRFPAGVRGPQPNHAQHRRGHQLQHHAHPLLYSGIDVLEREGLFVCACVLDSWSCNSRSHLISYALRTTYCCARGWRTGERAHFTAVAPTFREFLFLQRCVFCPLFLPSLGNAFTLSPLHRRVVLGVSCVYVLHFLLAPVDQQQRS